MTTQKDNDLPLTFRAEAVSTILRHISAGDSCLLIGIGSVGKSNLLRFLQREDILREKLGPEWKTYLFVNIDTNKMFKQSLWGLCELLIHQLVVELSNREVDRETVQTVDELHQRITNPKLKYLALRYLERAAELVCNRLDLRIVFMMDEFDDLGRRISSRGFAALRALRDDYKYRLMYVVATRVELNRLRKESAEIEAFEELVSPNTIWLGPYSKEDARFMVHRLEKRYGTPIGKSRTDELLEKTGGHPGLLRSAFYVALDHPKDLINALVSDWRIQDECQRIWHSLTADEQRAITALAGEKTSLAVDKNLVQKLERKGILGGPFAEPLCIFSPLFSEFIRRERPVVGISLQVDPQRRVVWIGERKTEKLPPLEFELISFLEKHRGQVCSRDVLLNHLYPEETIADGVSDTRLDSLVKRLRKRIEVDPKEPQYLLTAWGHGYQLADENTSAEEGNF